MQHKFIDPVADYQEVQVGWILFGTNTFTLQYFLFGGAKFSLSDKDKELSSSESEVSSLRDAIFL